MECVRLRVINIDLQYPQLLVRDDKDRKDRVTMRPDRLIDPFKQYSVRVETMHDKDLSGGSMYVSMAGSILVSAIGMGWQYVFPVLKTSTAPRSGRWRRHHIDETILRNTLKTAIRQAEFTKPAPCDTLHSCFAAHLREAGHDMRTIEELFGRKVVHTAKIHPHILNPGGRGIQGHADTL